LINISAQNADLKNVLLELANKTGISVKFSNSLEKRITIKISGYSLNEALSRVLKGLNHVIIYSGSRKNRNIVSEVLVYKMLKRSRISRPHEKQITKRIKLYERRLESLKKKLSQVGKSSRQGKLYLRQIRSYENIIEKYKRKIR
jgi:predicted RNase H-like nuclease (RuvC/YqgF family)